MKYIKSTIALVGICSFALLTACTNQESKPSLLLAEAKSDVDSAIVSGAEEYAPLETRSARNNLMNAEKAVDEENYQEARLLLEKSLADSELALIKTQARKSESAAKEIEDNLKTLKQAY